MKKEIFVFIFSCVFFASSVIIVFLLATNNPIITSGPKTTNARKTQSLLLPQGFGYFTLDPHIKVMNVYQYDYNTNRYEPVPFFPLRSIKNILGLSAKSRVYEKDVQNIIRYTNIKERVYNKEGNSMREAVNSKGIALKAIEPKYCKTTLLKGEFIISVQNVLPYEWRKSLTQDQMRGFFYKVKIN